MSTLKITISNTGGELDSLIFDGDEKTNVTPRLMQLLEGQVIMAGDTIEIQEFDKPSADDR